MGWGMTKYYRETLEDGLEYQDFVADQLRKMDPCIIVSAYASRKWQYDRGESSSGIEIKHDRWLNGENGREPTGRLYIEVGEKSKTEVLRYTPSGILREDNTWLYLIGDYTEAYLFSKKMLRMIWMEPEKFKARGIRERETETSRGFTIETKNPVMNWLCLKHILFKG